MSDSCFGTLLAKKNLMLSLKLIIAEPKPAWSHFPQLIMPHSRPSKNGREKWRTSVDTFLWSLFKTRLTYCTNHKLTGKKPLLLVAYVLSTKFWLIHMRGVHGNSKTNFKVMFCKLSSFRKGSILPASCFRAHLVKLTNNDFVMKNKKMIFDY